MIRARTLVPAVAAAVSLTVAACGSDTTTSGETTTTASATTAAQATAIEVVDPWARVTIGQASTTGVFMTLDNSTDSDDKLLKASVAATVAREAQLHETVTEDDTTTTMAGHDSMSMDEGAMTGGMAGMRQVAEIELPANSSVQLKPGGYHVMLIDLAKPLAAGDTFELTLEFDKAGSQTVQVTAKDM